MSEIIPKVCIKCKQPFPATREFFFADKKTKDHLNGRCKKCSKIRDMKPPDGFKRCTGCGQDLPRTPEYFHAHRSQSDGFRSQCKTCRQEKPWRPPDQHSRDNINERQRAYRLRRIEIAREYQHRYEASDRGRETHSAYRASHSEAIRERQRRYYASDHGRERFRSARRRRRARKHNALGTHTPEDIQAQYERQKGRCYYCNVQVQWGQHHIEHVVPLSRGGADDMSNIVIACKPCNLKKHNKLPHEWPEGGRLL